MHARENEGYCYALGRRGVTILDEEQAGAEQGDIATVFPGGSRRPANRGEADLRIIVVRVA